MTKLSIFAALLALGGCYAFPPAEVDQALAECADICSRYQECFDADFDAIACADRCETASRVDPAFAVRVSECQDCAAALGCGSTAFLCDAVCEEVIF